jgi:hypothetical protein
LAGLRGAKSGDSAGLYRPWGCGPVEIVNVCGSPAWQAFGAQSGRDHVGLRGGSLGEHGPGGAEDWAQILEIPRAAEQWLCGPREWGLVCRASYSFSISWHGEAFLELGVQSADVSALPGASPQPSVSPVSQQSPWFTELSRFSAVSKFSSWISPRKAVLMTEFL